MLAKINYILIGIASSLTLAVAFYYNLSLDSNLATLFSIVKIAPIYMFFYSLLTLGSIILFGINTGFLARRINSFGAIKIKRQLSSGFGSLIGIAASSCPVCGSTLLSFLGVYGGLAAFPFQGLELKAVSFGLLAVPILLQAKENKITKQGASENLTPENLCEDNICEPIEKSGEQKNKNPKNQKLFTAFLIILIIFIARYGWGLAKYDPLFSNFLKNPHSARSLTHNKISAAKEKTAEETRNKVIPESGFKSKISLNDAVIKMASSGIIDKKKFEEIYKGRGGIPEELKNILTENSNEKITLTKENANVYLNILWPLGLSNYMEVNNKNPIKGNDLFNFASTGGWTLGKEKNGGAYFNKFNIVSLTPEQEKLVYETANNIYRPCCGNSAFYEDCNHGSAILGLLELGANQGLSENELYREALAFNSFWFQDTYTQIGIYFKNLKNTDWENVDPKLILSKEFSSAYGFRTNVYKTLKDKNLLPEQKTGAGCGI